MQPWPFQKGQAILREAFEAEELLAHEGSRNRARSMRKVRPHGWIGQTGSVCAS